MNAWSRWIVVAALVLAVGLPPAGLAADSGSPLALVDISHALEGRTLAVTGRVVNRAATAVAGLIVDVTGYAPIGDPVFLATDGIPWGLAAGKQERFTARIPLTDRPVRAYAVKVALSRAPGNALVTLRRNVEASVYRPLLPSVVQVTGSLRGDALTVHAEAGQWPVAQVTVEATISVPSFEPEQAMILAPRNINAVIVQVPANGAAIATLESRGATLLLLRVIDAAPVPVWGD